MTDEDKDGVSVATGVLKGFFYSLPFSLAAWAVIIVMLKKIFT